MLPNLVIIGAQKSATTFLHIWLNEHPNIYLDTRENKSFEDQEYENFNLKSIDIDLDKSVSVYGIKRPAYFASYQIADRIRKHLDQPKILCILRNPVDRAISSCFHYMKYGIIPVRNPNTTFVEIITDPLKRKYLAHQNILEFGLYHKYLSHYFELFGKQNVLVLFYHEFSDKEKQTKLFQRICEFLNVENFRIPSPNIKPQTSIYSLIRLRIRSVRNRYVYKYDNNRSKSYDIPLNERTLIGKLINRVVLALDRRILKKIFPNNKPSISRKVKNLLLDFYIEDIILLQELLDVKLDEWKKV